MKNREEETKLEDEDASKVLEPLNSESKDGTNRREFLRKVGMIGGIALTQFALLGSAQDAYADCDTCNGDEDHCHNTVCDDTDVCVGQYPADQDKCINIGQPQLQDPDSCEGTGGQCPNDTDYCSAYPCSTDTDECAGAQGDTDLCESGTCTQDADECDIGQCTQDTDVCRHSGSQGEPDLCHEGGCGSDTDHCAGTVGTDLCHEGACGSDTDACLYPSTGADFCDPDDGDTCEPQCPPEDQDVCWAGHCLSDTDICDNCPTDDEDICDPDPNDEADTCQTCGDPLDAPPCDGCEDCGPPEENCP